MNWQWIDNEWQWIDWLYSFDLRLEKVKQNKKITFIISEAVENEKENVKNFSKFTENTSAGAFSPATSLKRLQIRFFPVDL